MTNEDLDKILTLADINLDNLKNRVHELYEENERLKEENNNKAMNDYAHAIDESWYRELYDDYKSRCEKASDNLKRNYWINEHEHNDDVVNMTLNILQNGSEKDE